LADIQGTYDIAMNSYWDGALTETGIIVDKAADSDTILIKNLLSAGSLIKAVFDPVLGKITLEDMQLLVSDANVGLPDLQSIYFVNAATDGAVVFNVPSPAKITSTQMWGYYMLPKKGWYDVFTASTWTRKSTDVTIPQGVKSKFISKKNILTGARRSLKK
jgi:hypothetical protein